MNSVSERADSAIKEIDGILSDKKWLGAKQKTIEVSDKAILEIKNQTIQVRQLTKLVKENLQNLTDEVNKLLKERQQILRNIDLEELKSINVRIDALSNENILLFWKSIPKFYKYALSVYFAISLIFMLVILPWLAFKNIKINKIISTKNP